MKKRKKKKSFWKRLFLFFLLPVGIIIAAAAIFAPKQTEAVGVTVSEVEIRTITSTVTATGKIYPQVEVKISSEVAGEIMALPIVEGQRVEKGQLLVEVDSDIYRTQVRQREASVASAKARELQAKAQLLQAELDFRRFRDLQEKEFLAQSALDDAETQMKVAEANYQASQSEVQQMEMLLDQAREELSKTTIYAPMNGTISRLNTELGERVVGTGQFEGTEILRIADLDNMEVRIDVSEADIVNVKIDDPATITIDAIPNASFKGQVAEIANSATITGENSREQLTTFEVRIRLLDRDPRIRPGMTATADIETATVENVIAVPLQSVTVRNSRDIDRMLKRNDKPSEDTSDNTTVAAAENDTDQTDATDTTTAETNDSDHGKGTTTRRGEGSEEQLLERLVFVAKDGVARIRVVKTGISDNAWMEIIEGVEEGETVISGSYSAISRQLEEGKAIEVQEDGQGGGRWNRG